VWVIDMKCSRSWINHMDYLGQCGPTFSYPRADQTLVYESEGQRH
jgi:hypothetical protein